MDTHTYDGKVPNNIIKRTNEERKAAVEELIMLIKKYKDGSENIVGFCNLITIFNDVGNNSNYDHSNDYSADDIIFELISQLKNKDEEFIKDIIKLICIQLQEMSSGMCPQGRTHRLYQIYKILI